MINGKRFFIAMGSSLIFFLIIDLLYNYARWLKHIDSDILTWVSISIFFSLVIGIYAATEDTPKGRRKG